MPRDSSECMTERERESWPADSSAGVSSIQVFARVCPAGRFRFRRWSRRALGDVRMFQGPNFVELSSPLNGPPFRL